MNNGEAIREVVFIPVESDETVLEPEVQSTMEPVEAPVEEPASV